MTATANNTKPSPIEVWLRLDNLRVACMVVRQDETTYELDVDALSMRGAQRELTSWLLRDGYEPIGRWADETEDESGAETVRRFRLRD